MLRITLALAVWTGYWMVVFQPSEVDAYPTKSQQAEQISCAKVKWALYTHYFGDKAKLKERARYEGYTEDQIREAEARCLQGK